MATRRQGDLTLEVEERDRRAPCLVDIGVGDELPAGLGAVPSII